MPVYPLQYDTATGTMIVAQLASGQVGSGTVQSGDIAPGAVLSANIASGQVGVNHFQSGAIQSGQVGTAAVLSGNIASGQIGTLHIASGTIVAADLASGAIVSGLIGNAAVVSGNIASGQVGGFHVAAAALGSGLFAAGAIVSGYIASGQIGQFHIASGAITSGAIASGQAQPNALASGAVLTQNLASGIVVSGNVASGQLGTFHIAAGANGVLSANIGSGQLGGQHHASGVQFVAPQAVSGPLVILPVAAAGARAVLEVFSGIGFLRTAANPRGGLLWFTNTLVSGEVAAVSGGGGQIGIFDTELDIVFPPATTPGSAFSYAVTNYSLGSGGALATSGYWALSSWMGSGQIGNFHIASGAVLSNSVASGQLGTNHLATGALVSASPRPSEFLLSSIQFAFPATLSASFPIPSGVMAVRIEGIMLYAGAGAASGTVVSLQVNGLTSGLYSGTLGETDLMVEGNFYIANGSGVPVWAPRQIGAAGISGILQATSFNVRIPAALPAQRIWYDAQGAGGANVSGAVALVEGAGYVDLNVSAGMLSAIALFTNFSGIIRSGSQLRIWATY